MPGFLHGLDTLDGMDVATSVATRRRLERIGSFAEWLRDASSDRTTCDLDLSVRGPPDRCSGWLAIELSTRANGDALYSCNPCRRGNLATNVRCQQELKSAPVSGTERCPG